MIRLRVLGSVELRAADGRPLHSVLAQPKRLALLAYLAIASPGGFQRRDRLLGLFWPEVDAERGRGALNQAVYHLRRAVGSDVIVSRGPGDLGVDRARLWCDVVAFEQALNDDAVHEALDLYRGDMLAGFFLSDAVEWERWLEDERARLQSRAAAGAWSLAEEAAARGSAADARAWAHRSMGLTPGDEPRLRQLLLLLCGMGDRIGALHAYEEIVAQWTRDVEIEPSRETLDLVERIRAGDLPAAKAVAPATLSAAADQGRTVESGTGPTAAPTMVPASRKRSGSRLVAVSLAAVALLAALITLFALMRAGPASDPVTAGTARPGPLDGTMARRPSADSPGGAASGPTAPVGSEAYADYLTGRHLLTRLDARAFAEARDRFQRAVDAEPLFADAWSGLAESFIQLATMSVLPADEAYPRARAAAERALALDPGLAEAHGALGMALAMYDWDTSGAERHFRLAIDFNPGSASIRRMYAAHLRNLGHFDEAIAQIRTAQTLDPLFAFAHIEEGLTLYAARRYGEALRKFDQYLLAHPADAHAYIFLALIHVELRQYDDALDALRRTDPERQRPDALAFRGVVLARMGRADEARAMLAALDRLEKEGRFVSPFHRAATYATLGEFERALDLLEEAAEQRTQLLRLLKVTPTWDSLRTEPRFQALLARVGLLP